MTLRVRAVISSRHSHPHPHPQSRHTRTATNHEIRYAGLAGYSSVSSASAPAAGRSRVVVLRVGGVLYLSHLREGSSEGARGGPRPGTGRGEEGGRWKRGGREQCGVMVVGWRRSCTGSGRRFRGRRMGPEAVAFEGGGESSECRGVWGGDRRKRKKRRR